MKKKKTTGSLKTPGEPDGDNLDTLGSLTLREMELVV